MLWGQHYDRIRNVSLKDRSPYVYICVTLNETKDARNEKQSESSKSY